MPLCTIDTNLRRDDIAKDFNEDFTKLIAATLGKKEETVTLKLHTGVDMCNAGSTNPIVCVQVDAIDVFEQGKNPEYVKPLMDFIVATLKVPLKRIMVQFRSVTREMAANLLYK